MPPQPYPRGHCGTKRYAGYFFLFFSSDKTTEGQEVTTCFVLSPPAPELPCRHTTMGYCVTVSSARGRNRRYFRVSPLLTKIPVSKISARLLTSSETASGFLMSAALSLKSPD